MQQKHIICLNSGGPLASQKWKSILKIIEIRSNDKKIGVTFIVIIYSNNKYHPELRRIINIIPNLGE